MAQPTTTSQERELTTSNKQNFCHLQILNPLWQNGAELIMMLNYLIVCGDGIAAERFFFRRLRFSRDGKPFGTVFPHDKVIHNDGGEEDEEDYLARRESSTQHRHEVCKPYAITNVLRHCVKITK